MSKPEEWRDIPGYEGHYQASSWGRVRSLGRVTVKKGGVRMTVRERILSGRAHRYGYSSYVLRKNGKSHPYHGHVLVMRAFHGMPEPGLIICHNDSDGSNNRLDNLRYDTVKSNSADMVSAGTSLRGERNPNAILGADEVIDIRNRRAQGEKVSSIAKHYRVSTSLVGAVVRGDSWDHVDGPRTVVGRKVTEHDIVAMRYLRAAGASINHLARTYGVSITYTSKICFGSLHPALGGPLTKPSLQRHKNIGVDHA